MQHVNPSKLEIELPELHSGQVAAWELEGRFKCVRCGRRWGKTKFGVTVAADAAIAGQRIGWFAPDYKRILEPRGEIFQILDPVVRTSSKTEGQITTITDGLVDFWTLNDELAGRGREYHGIIVDEAAFAGPNMMDIWKLAIRPTLVRYRGWVLVLSNTNGVDEDQFFWKIINEKDDTGRFKHGFIEYHAPSHDNPYLPREELEDLERTEMPDVYRQEYLAEFVDWTGKAFFTLASMCGLDGLPVDFPPHCDSVYATIDTATKTGKEHDGTGVVYWAYSNPIIGLPPLTVLDYDVAQIEGGSLVTWLPGVFARLEELARMTKARQGSLGAFIEDKNSGSVLIQQAKNLRMPARAIDSKLTSLGKDERAISVSRYVYGGQVKMSKFAHSKVVVYKGASRNHLITQVVGFRIGDKDSSREDDLLDGFCYGVALALGNPGGF